jgi:predicted DNA-binding antitoxin AbrB/MazE fold protein
MTVKVKFHNGVFEPIAPIKEMNIEEGAELEIQILYQDQKNKLKGIIGLFSDLSDKEIQKFEEAAKRRPLFEKREVE